MTPDRATAIRCAELVADAYAWSSPRPMVAPIDGGIALVFAGSRSAGDWCLDLESWHDKRSWTDGAGIHAGFARIADEAYFPSIRACPMDLGARRVVITGHSLGAAVALLTACHLKRVLGVPAEVVAFGCPRVGDSAFHRLYRAAAIPTLRISCAHDPFAHLPGFWGWRHVGDHLHVDEDGTPLPDPTGLRETLRYWSRWPIGHLDHSMMGYRIALAAHEHRGFAWPT